VYLKIHRDGNKKLLVCPYKGIGDIYFIGAYIREYCKKEEIKAYSLVLTGNICRRVAEMFGIEDLVLLSAKDMDRLVKYIQFAGEKITNSKILNHNCTHIGVLSKFDIAGRLSWGEIFLNGIFEFDSAVSASAPVISPRGKYEEIKEGKTVILSPYANTVKNIDVTIWEELTNELLKKGFDVITNSSGKDEPVIKGSKEGFYPLEDMVHIVEKAGYFIGVRSGLCDVISAAKAKKIVLYPDKASMFFSIEKMGLSGDVEEVLLDGQYNGKIVCGIINKM